MMSRGCKKRKRRENIETSVDIEISIRLKLMEMILSGGEQLGNEDKVY